MIKKYSYFQDYLFREHSADLKDYLNGWVEHLSQEDVIHEFKENPYLGKQVVDDWTTNKRDVNINVKRLLDMIRAEETYVILLMGMGGSGKGTSAWKICELLRKEFNIKTVMPIADKDTLPSWATAISHVYYMEKGDLIIYDEAGVRANSRKSSTKENEMATSWLPIGRHTGAKVIYISQFSAIADVNISRFTNISITKGHTTSAFGNVSERIEVSNNPALKYFSLHPQDINYAGVPSNHKDWACVTSQGQTFMCYLPMPKFYSNALSKPFRKYIERTGGDVKKAEQMAMDDAKQMFLDGQSINTIWSEVFLRGIKKSKQEWADIFGVKK